MDGVIDFVRGQAPSAHLHTVAVEDVADRSPINAEQGTQLIGRGTVKVTLDQRLGLDRVELPCPTRFRPVDGLRSGRGRVGELLEQRLQGFYLGFCVVSSPKVHR